MSSSLSRTGARNASTTFQAATVFSRAGDGWVEHVLTDGAVLAVPEIRVDLPPGDLYGNMEFSEVCSVSAHG